MSTRKVTNIRSRRAASRPKGIRRVQANPKINMLVYGHPGSGKTRLIGSGPEGRTLIIAPPTDHRDSIRGIDMDEWVIHSWVEMFEALEWCRIDAAKFYDWVWLDSISLFQDTGLDDIWSDIIARKPDRMRYGLDRGDYGVNMFRLGQWVRHMVGAETVNLGITAHPTEMDNPYVEDPDDANTILMPYVQGKNMSDKVCGYMNIVGYMRPVKDKKTGNMRRVLSVELTERWYGKDQFNAFPNGRMVDPTIPRIIAAIRSEATPISRSKKGA